MILLCSLSYLVCVILFLLYFFYLLFFYLYVKNWIIWCGIVYNLMNVVYDYLLIDDEMKKGYFVFFYDNCIFFVLICMI